MQRQRNRHSDWDTEKDEPGGCLRWKLLRDGVWGESKLTRRVKCKKLSTWGPGGLGESGTVGPGARSFLSTHVALYLREGLGLGLK